MTLFNAVGFGALNVDKLFKVNRLAEAEEESFIEDYAEACGGSAANTMVGLSRLGCRVGFIGKVGCDREGDLLLRNFESEGVDVKSIIREKQGKSGSVLGFVDRKGSRALYISSGVNDTIGLEDVDIEYASQAQFLHLTSFVGRKSFQTQKRLLKAISKVVQVSFDPGALYARKGYAALEPLLDQVHIFMPNAIELELLTGKQDYCIGADFMIERGIKIVAVKLGDRGCYITDGRERHLVAPFKVKSMDTTGAGDAFCAGFLFGLINNKSLFECGRLGNFVASRSITKMGARAGLPFANDLKLIS